MDFLDIHLRICEAIVGLSFLNVETQTRWLIHNFAEVPQAYSDSLLAMEIPERVTFHLISYTKRYLCVFPR